MVGPPSLSSLLGAADGDCSSLSSLGKTEVCLILSPAPGISLNFIYLHTGCEGYWRPFFKIVSCISLQSDHAKIFTVYPTLYLLLGTDVHLPARLKGPQPESQRGVVVKIICAV
jgi:hypothetical protein